MEFENIEDIGNMNGEVQKDLLKCNDSRSRKKCNHMFLYGG